MFKKWLDKLKTEGRTDEEIGKMLAGVAKLSAAAVYMALMTALTEEDMKSVEAIESDGEAKKKMEKLFKLRTGMSVRELAEKAQSGFAEEYLKK